MAKVEQVDPKCIQKTKDTLGKLISKPPLTDNLLNRPPFRYLHDIITELIRSTGFLEGLFSAEEMNVTNIQDKNQKMSFLQKAIDAVAFVTGEIPKVRSSRIIAGQECERTNELLQALAGAVLKKLDSTEAVQMVLRGEKPADGLRKDKKKQKPQKSDKPPPGDGGRDKGKEKPKVPSSKKPPSDRPQEDGEEGDPRKSSDAIKSASSQLVQSRSDLSGDKQKGGKEKKHRDKKEKRGKEKQGSEQPPQQEDPPLEDGEGQRSRKVDRKQDEDQEVVNSKDSPESQVAHTRPPSAKGGRKRQTNDEVPPSGPTINGPTSDEDKQEGRSEDIGVVPTTRERQSLKQDDPVDEAPSVPVAQEERPSTPPLPPMAIATQMKRPGSARPAPPRIVRHQPTQDVPVSVSTGSVSAPRVILDTEKNDDDEKFIVEETQLPEHHTLVQDPTMSDGIDRSTVGALARTMIETKERLEGSLGKDKTHEGPRISEAERRKQREMIAREIEKLQSGIQALCRSTTPLGKIVDYVQEDIESMQKELDTWRKENTQHTEALRREESVTDQELQPLRAQLDELESHIKEQNELIMASKVNIMTNDRRIQQILQNMSFSLRT